MDVLHRGCEIWPALASSIITLIIPYGVFCRYVLNSAASWPEPMAVLLMIVMSFLSAVVCYREYLHIGVGVLPAYLRDRRRLSRLVSRDCMLATNLFMLVWGIKLVEATLAPEHPGLSGTSALACPICRFRWAAR
jgi:TRAP-type C4-dicarboxylate transport system permease small subunit